MAKYKTKCARCKKHYLIASWRTKFPICYYCQEPEMQGEIKDAKMKKMFDIPTQFYIDSSFLRDIKIKYLRYGNLTDPQIDAFKKAVVKFEEEAKKPKDEGTF
uniref:Uncharacterized protein n=1 Tax=uncultured marine group II/III euryarchaeote KM3_83_G03 TaxID=1456522 RepID=A0A075HT42_9EURY|nr:hypothetical protein [uncultured marine group II/III euryarchaeote KM3_83_G03]